MAADYDLVLMLDPEAPEERREQIAAEVRKLIEAGGTVKRADEWGMRRMSYEIRHRVEADYRYFNFEAESSVLERLNHTLKISDGVLRFRTIRLDSRMPPVPDVKSMPVVTSGVKDERGRGRGGEDRSRDSAPFEEASQAPTPEAPAEPAPAEESPPATDAAVDAGPDTAEAPAAPEAAPPEAPVEPETPAEPDASAESPEA